MSHLSGLLFGALLCGQLLCAQTAEELVAKNTQAKGGLAKIKAIRSLRMTGKLQQGSFTARVAMDAMRPDLLRQTFSIQGMSQIEAYDGSMGWRISPFEGRKDPELLGEDDLRPLIEEADFYGPLIDHQEKGNKIEYLGHETLDGDDAYRLKVTLRNGDILYYYLDPDTYLEIRTEKQMFIRGAVRETFTEYGSYKLVNGVYYPFSMETGSKASPGSRAKVILDKVEANVPINESEFRMPAQPATPSPQTHPEPPPQKPPAPEPVKKPRN